MTAPNGTKTGSLEREAAPPDSGELSQVVYDELKALAIHFLRGRRSGDSLSPTILVHETYLRLARRAGIPFESRGHFFGIAAKAMRSILVDHARRRGAAKRGGGRAATPATLDPAAAELVHPDVVAVDEALTRLADFDARKAQVVELRFFGGLDVEEAAEALSVSTATVKRDWALAKAWLKREIAR